jgi:hypothetical protein
MTVAAAKHSSDDKNTCISTPDALRRLILDPVGAGSPGIDGVSQALHSAYCLGQATAL